MCNQLLPFRKIFKAGKGYSLTFFIILVIINCNSIVNAQSQIDLSVFKNYKIKPFMGFGHSGKDTLIPDDKTTPHLYRMNYGFTIPFSIIATAADIYAIPNIIHSKKDLTDQELQTLNTSIFSSFDRWALDLNPANRDKFYKNSDYVLPIIVTSAAILGFDKKIRSDWVRILLMYYEMHAITFSIYNFSFFGPAFQNKFRPVVYYNYFSFDERRGGNQRNSMYSGHVASGTAATFFMVKVYSDYHPEIGGKKYLLYGLASIPPLFEGYLRVKALAHFPSDVMIGYVIGAITGIVVPQLHRYKNQSLKLGLNYSVNGPALSLVWHPGLEHKSNNFKFITLDK